LEYYLVATISEQTAPATTHTDDHVHDG